MPWDTEAETAQFLSRIKEKPLRIPGRETRFRNQESDSENS